MAACAIRSRAGDAQVSNGWAERLPMPVIREVRTGGSASALSFAGIQEIAPYYSNPIEGTSYRALSLQKGEAHDE
jgi:hypothetical protein